MNNRIKLVSELDKSVNLVEKHLEGFLESRYVRKTPEYFITYISSQTGCNRGCKFCHLTTTKQTKSIDATADDIIKQAHRVFNIYNDSEEKAEYMHYNFMARGEPFDSKVLFSEGDNILSELGKFSKSYGLKTKFNISTIIPKSMKGEISDYFNFTNPTIYYSLYSTSTNFRKKWIPNGLPIDEAGQLLKKYQDFSKKLIKIHFCFIRGENDSINDVNNMLYWVEEHNLKCEFNLVRYNPFSSIQGEESEESILKRNMSIISDYMKSKEIPRVGFDVKASCGMFVNK